MTGYRDFQDAGAVVGFKTLGRIERAAHVTRSLNTTRALVEPGFSLAVLHHYAQHKISRGKSKMQLHGKLEALELRMPHFSNDFRTVRRQLELMPSRVLPDGQLGPPPPPYFNAKGECSCSCSCGAREREADPVNGYFGAVAGVSDVAPDALPMRDMRNMREILAGPGSLTSTAPSSPGLSTSSTFSSPSSSSSVSSMSMLSGDNLSTDALATMNMLAPPRRPRGLGIGIARFRMGSSSSLVSQ